MSKEHLKYAAEFFRSNPELAAKYGSESAINAVASLMEKNRALPSPVSAELAFRGLKLPRVDGGDEYSDSQAAVAAAQRTLDQAIRDAEAPELTKQECEEFASLSRAELSRRYWGEDGDGINLFATRYRKAHREMGYVLPERSGGQR